MFRACLAHIVSVVGDIPGLEPRLHVVLEQGHSNAEDALRSYKSVQNQVTAARRALAGLTFDDKNCLPLAAADQFAYTAWGEKVGQKPLGIPKKPVKSARSYRLNMSWIDLNRDILNSLHEQAFGLTSDPLSSIFPSSKGPLS